MRIARGGRLRESSGGHRGRIGCQRLDGECAWSAICKLHAKHLTLRIPSCQRVEKLDLCKKTLNLLLRELHHDDRFCLISFSDEAKVEVPMLKVCDDQKQRAMHTIEHMRVRGRTNVASALSLAAQVANGVKVSLASNRKC